jgi:hypothetical protein
MLRKELSASVGVNVQLSTQRSTSSEAYTEFVVAMPPQIPRFQKDTILDLSPQLSFGKASAITPWMP